MATSDQGASDRTYKAGASFASSQYLVCKISAPEARDGNPATVVVMAALTDVPAGVIQDKAASGDVTQVRVQGRTKLWAGGTITAGDPIKASAAGKALTAVIGTDTTHYVIGTAVESAVDGDIFTADVDFLAPGRAS